MKYFTFILTLVILQFPFFIFADSSRGIKKLGQSLSSSQNRFALVIGNSNYKVAPLKNPENDARDISKSLSKLGFKVDLLENAAQRDMKKAIDSFGERIKSGGVGLFYFAGHGVQVDGRNYLVPVNADIETENDVEYESIDTGRVLAKMEDANNGMNIMILDACRNNPYASSFRSISNGLATLNAPSGTFIAYATSPGNVAADGEGDNGIYTGYLIRHLNSKDLSIENVFKRVRRDVQKKTGGKQIPWDSSSLTGDFYFNKTKNHYNNIIYKNNVQIDSPEIEKEKWEIVKNTNNIKTIRNYIKSNPYSKFCEVAKLKLNKLNNEKGILDDLKSIYSKIKDKYILEKPDVIETELPECIEIKLNDSSKNKIDLNKEGEEFSKTMEKYVQIKTEYDEHVFSKINFKYKPEDNETLKVNNETLKVKIEIHINLEGDIINVNLAEKSQSDNFNLKLTNYLKNLILNPPPKIITTESVYIYTLSLSCCSKQN